MPTGHKGKQLTNYRNTHKEYPIKSDMHCKLPYNAASYSMIHEFYKRTKVIAIV